MLLKLRVSRASPDSRLVASTHWQSPEKRCPETVLNVMIEAINSFRHQFVEACYEDLALMHYHGIGQYLAF